MRVNSYTGIAMVIIFSTTLILAVSNFPGYDPFKNYLSDLGVNENSSFYFNTGAILTGILGILFAIKLNKPLFYTFVAASIGLIGVGIFHSKIETAHLVFAGIFFIFSAITILFESENKKGTEKYLLIATGLLPFAFILTFWPVVEHIAATGILLFVLHTACRKK